MQARTLLAAVEGQGRIGPRMVAYYACLYYAALRPEEGVGIEVPRNLRLPDSDDEWASSSWKRPSRTPGRRGPIPGGNRDRRQLKQGAIGEVRRVACPPALTGIIRRHVARFGLSLGGRLFVGERGAGWPVDLLRIATGLEISGGDADKWPATFRSEVVRRIPRLTLGEEFLRCFEDQARRKPASSAAAAVEGGLVGRIASNVLDRAFPEER
jgi:hypothetical protein